MSYIPETRQSIVGFNMLSARVTEPHNKAGKPDSAISRTIPMKNSGHAL